MNTIHKSRILLSILALLLVQSVQSAIDPLALAPDESEVIARLDCRKLVESEQFKIFMEEAGEEEIRAKAGVLKSLTDLDVFTDIDEIYLFGLIDDDASVILAVKGRFNQEKLVSLVSLNDTYEKGQADGLTIHNWEDDGDKYATFLEEDLLLFAGSRGAMEQALEAKKAKAQSFLGTPVAATLPGDLNQSPFWGMLIRTPMIDCEFGDLARAIDLDYVLLTGDMMADRIDAMVTAYPSNASLVDTYERAANGALAVGDLLKEEQPMLMPILEQATVGKSADGRAVKLSCSITNRDALLIAKEKGI